MKTAISSNLSRIRRWFPLASVLAMLLTASLPSRAATPADRLVARGGYLAKIGDCAACHTVQGGADFAGGLPMQMPVGTIYTTNITPDPHTGIGRYTRDDFERALRHGVARDHNLYPAMPYPSFSKISDEDVDALYAYFMKSVKPVKQRNRQPDIPWPLDMRWPLKLWNLFFLDDTVYRAKPNKDPVWNRGAYLVQGLAHCGACHTPRGVAMQELALDEKSQIFLSGASLDGWFASNLTGDNNAGLGRWTENDLHMFLKTGANVHASAYGPMTDVINKSTQYLSDEDQAAIARYLRSLVPSHAGDVNEREPYRYDGEATAALVAGTPLSNGARVYLTYCVSCHGVDGRGRAPFIAPLAGNPDVLGTNPLSLINVTLNGATNLVIGGVPAAYPMPKFKLGLTNQDISDVLSFVRSGWNNSAPAIEAQDVAKVRASTSSK
ncbi:mono/diheme cytochrome c family protein [Caballeronia udeis]|uniref:Mono/diheme cytochrome c family protein n=1 Tax=Caballeronia udeis TaxID=1232866 RepID=A0ABW8MQU5_9BURK